MVLEKPVKSSGGRYDASLSDEAQFVELRQKTIQGIGYIDKSGPPGKLKLWCLQFSLLPHLMWPLTLHEVPLSKAEKLENMMNSCQKIAWSLICERHMPISNFCHYII